MWFQIVEQGNGLFAVIHIDGEGKESVLGSELSLDQAERLLNNGGEDVLRYEV